MKEKRYIWISWERQRRSVELAATFGCCLYIFEYKGPLRYPISILKTLMIIFTKKPDVLFVQNPSIVLAALAGFVKKVSGIILVVDRHSNFLLTTNTNRSTFYEFIFRKLSEFSIRNADITIVTNNFIANIVKKQGGTPFILPDKLPFLVRKNTKNLKGEKKILLISSFALDEPVKAVLEAMLLLKKEGVCLYISGNDQKLNMEFRSIAPENVIFTGFLSEQDFQDMVFSVDVVMALTTIDHCMLCGCYEAVAAAKPLITSDKDVLKNYFQDMVYVANTPESIADGIDHIFERIDKYKNKSLLLKIELSFKWDERKTIFESKLTGLLSTNYIGSDNKVKQI